MKLIKQKYQASALVVSLLVLFAVVTTALSVSLVSIKERNISSSASKSVQAFQNANAGVENVMYEITKGGHTKVSEIASALGTGVSCSTNKEIIGKNYTVQLEDASGNIIDCNSNEDISKVATIKSVGRDTGGRTQRAISAAVRIATSSSPPPTVTIGTQTWMKYNMNVGTMIASSNNQGTSCSSIQKYCYDDDENNCNTDGALYQWNQAMCGSTTPGAQGICPTGFHIPTDAEQNTLEQYLATGSCNASRTNYSCKPAGTALKVGGSSGFEGILAGYCVNSCHFRNTYAYIWSSSENGPYVWKRQLNGGYNVGRSSATKICGFSVRCIKN